MLGFFGWVFNVIILVFEAITASIIFVVTTFAGGKSGESEKNEKNQKIIKK